MILLIRSAYSLAIGVTDVACHLVARDVGRVIDPKVVQGKLVEASVEGLSGTLAETLVSAGDGRVPPAICRGTRAAGKRTA